jgi:hypothetical protein
VCVVVTLQVAIGDGEVLPGVGLALLIAQALRGSERAPVRGDPVVPAALVVEEVHQAPGELPGWGAETRLGGQLDQPQEHPVLGPEPGQRLLAVADVLWRDPRRGGRQPDRIAGSVQSRGRAVRGTQVEVEDAPQRRPLVRVADVHPYLFRGVRVQEIMERESRQRVLGQQM